MKVKYTLDLQINTTTKPVKYRFEDMGEYDTHEEAWQAVRERVLKITGEDKLPNYTCYDLSPRSESTNFLISGEMYHFIITEIIIELDDDDE